MDNLVTSRIIIDCPCCGSKNFTHWAEENKHSVVRCVDCKFLYLNPRPNDEQRNTATKEGAFSGESNIDITETYSVKKISHYEKLYSLIFKNHQLDTINKSWLDIGCGYGEIMNGIKLAADPTCKIKGVEPMRVKANFASAAGLDVLNDFYYSSLGSFDYISIHDVFSHIPNPLAFFQDVRAGLNKGGYVIVETGNLADLAHRSDFPGDLGLPDHMIFAGTNNIRMLLEKNGFEIVSLNGFRIDGLLYFLKNIVKYAIGRKVVLRLPYTSKYRTLIILAKAV